MKFCKDCLHFSGHDDALTSDCKHPLVACLNEIITGKKVEGAAMGAAYIRLTECGEEGKFWEPVL